MTKQYVDLDFEAFRVDPTGHFALFLSQQVEISLDRATGWLAEAHNLMAEVIGLSTDEDTLDISAAYIVSVARGYFHLQRTDGGNSA